MSDEEIGFEDWEKEAELIVINAKEQTVKMEQNKGEVVKDNPEVHRDPLEAHLKAIESIKNMALAQFEAQFMHNEQKGQQIEPFSALLKAEREFVELASNIGSHFRAKAKQSVEKVLPENETVAFFEQFLLYLYGSMEWESIETVKEKTKIVKKQKKEQQAKVKKLREKELRLKRGFTKQQQSERQGEAAKNEPNEMEMEEGM